MKLFNKSYTYIYILVLMSFVSCTEIIDMRVNTDFERLLVDAQIMDQDTLQYVNLSKINLDASDTIVSPISNAMVVVNNGTQDYVFTESKNRAGLYVSPNDFAGEAAKTYSLSVSNVGVLGQDGTDNYSASAYMARSLKMDSTTAVYEYRPQFGINGYMLKCWAWDPPEQNYYLFKAWKNGVILTDTLYEFNQSDDLIFNGNYISGVNCQLLRDEKPDEYVESGDTLTLELDNIDQAYYDYLNSAQGEYRGTNPLFGGPPANVTTNISNGAVGIYRVFTVSKESVVVIEADRSANPNYDTQP